MLMKAFQEVRFKQGQQIIKQGEPGDKFYLLDSGTCDIAVQGKGTVMKATRGLAFGELALLHNAPRAATVTAESDVSAWQVDAATFKSILMSKSKSDAQDYASFIKEVPLLKSLSKEDVRSLLDALEEQAFGAEQQLRCYSVNGPLLRTFASERSSLAFRCNRKLQHICLGFPALDA